jgi:hypothetical protein
MEKILLNCISDKDLLSRKHIILKSMKVFTKHSSSQSAKYLIRHFYKEDIKCPVSTWSEVQYTESWKSNPNLNIISHALR